MITSSSIPLLYAARALRGFGDGFAIILLPVYLSALGYDACLREIEDSRVELERIAGVSVETFAYPFGRYGPEALAAARDSAVIAAVTTGSGSWERYEMTRAMIGAIDPLAVILLKLDDRYEPLLQSPPARLARSSSKRLRQSLGSRRRGGEPAR